MLTYKEYCNNNLLLIKDLLKTNNISQKQLFLIAYMLNNKKIIKNLDKKQNNKDEILAYSCLSSNLNLVKKVIEYNKIDIFETSSAFISACAQNNFKIVELIYNINNKYNPEHKFKTNTYIYALLNNKIKNALFCKSKNYITYDEEITRLSEKVLKMNQKKVLKMNQKKVKAKTINNKNIRKLITKYIPKNPF